MSQRNQGFDELSVLYAQVRAMRDSEPQEPVSGEDSSGAVTATLDAHGNLESLVILREWKSSLRPASVPGACEEAIGSAVQRRRDLWEKSAAEARERLSRASAFGVPAYPPPADAARPLSELMSMMVFDPSRKLVEESVRPLVTREGVVQLVPQPDGAVKVIIEESFLGRASSTQINAEFASAVAVLREEVAVESNSFEGFAEYNRELNEAFSEVMYHLMNAGR